MARPPKIDYCIFCDSCPCECSKAKKAPIKRLPKIQPVTQNILPQDRSPEESTQRNYESSEDDVLLANAIRVLAPLLSLEDKERYKWIISSSPTAAEEAVMWRARRRLEDGRDR